MTELLLKGYVAADIRLQMLCERFKRDVRGAGTAEYAMIIGIAVVLGIAILRKFWGESEDEGLQGIFNNIMGRLQGSISEGTDGGALGGGQ